MLGSRNCANVHDEILATPVLSLRRRTALRDSRIGTRLVGGHAQPGTDLRWIKADDERHQRHRACQSSVLPRRTVFERVVRDRIQASDHAQVNYEPAHRGRPGILRKDRVLVRLTSLPFLECHPRILDVADAPTRQTGEQRQQRCVGRSVNQRRVKEGRRS